MTNIDWIYSPEVEKMEQVTLGELFQLYVERHLKTRTKRPDNGQYFFARYCQQWSEVPINRISRAAVQIWIDGIGADYGPSAANRAINTMSAAINWGIRRGYVTLLENPCKGVERFETQSRRRFLLPEEMQRFRDALEVEGPLMRDFFWLCLLTGARKTNVLRMRWEHVDLDLGLWMIPAAEFKNGSDHTIPLSAAALAVLSRRKGDDATWVFPGRRKGRPLAEPKRAWGRLMERSRLRNLTIHDLRRTVGSYLAIQGTDVVLIAKTLGHKDLRSTQVYTHLNVQPVRAALDSIQHRWLA